MRFSLPLTLTPLGAAGAAWAEEPKVEAGFQVTLNFLEELDVTDVGFGGRLSFRPASSIAVEGEVSLFPADVPSGDPVTSSRLEGLFASKWDADSTASPYSQNSARDSSVSAKLPVRSPVSRSIHRPSCCVLAEGQTVLALDVGGGVELFPNERSVLRVDVSSLLLRYPGPAFTRAGEAIESDGFWGGNLRISFGAGFRF